MRLIGGVVVRGPRDANVSAAVESLVRGMPGVTARAGDGPVALVSGLRDGHVEATDLVLHVADLDLTNLEDLHAVTGEPGNVAGLISALYALEGPGFVRRLRGAFAIALWDRRRQTLMLAVDQVGIKRLYHATTSAAFAFASRVDALRAVASVDVTVEPTAVYNYLNFGYVPAPASILRGVERLAPGHLLVLREGTARLERYWDASYPARHVREAVAVSEMARLTEEAVGRTLRDASAKETGTFLSGGTDSSTVLGFMSRLTGERISAFSVGFHEERYDEQGYAAIAARHFGASHYIETVTADAALAAMPRIVDAYDEPFGNNSAIGTFFCAQLAASCGMTRLLAGDGGDEIFGGNERYATDRVFARYQQVPAVVRSGLLEPALRLLPDGGDTVIGRAQRYVRRASLPNPRRFYSYEFYFAQNAAEFLTRDFRAAVAAGAPYEVLERHWAQVDATSELNRLLYLDLKLTLGDSDLFKVVRTAELAAVDIRFPLLDLDLMDFMAGLPPHYKVRGTEKRYLFKRAFRPLLPAAILGKRKHGFGVPAGDWIRGHHGFRALAADTLLSARARQRGYLRPGIIDRLFALHGTERTVYYGDMLWRLLMLELWARRHAEGAAR
jgi:asparagine synthase (glutamine-hydrolysing)